MLRLSPRESFPHSNSAFTLVELLVVIAIIAILSVVVIMVLNPIELLRQARDSNRISDLTTLHTALAAFNADQSTGFMGTSTVVYISVPDSSGTCANLGLPTLPSGWSYNCATSANLRKTNGTGWVPVNLTSISFGTPLATLPIDPQNTTTTMYYTYVPGGSWQLSARLESQRYQPKAALTNDYDPGLYIQGSDTDLAPFLGGLVGWWKFDEGSGGSVLDSSGYGNTGTWNGTSTSRYVTGKVGAYAGYFNGQSDYIPTTATPSASNATICMWVSDIGNLTGGGAYILRSDANSRTYLSIPVGTTNISFVKGNPAIGITGTGNLNSSQWYFICLVWKNDNGTLKAFSYLNGTIKGSDFSFTDTTPGTYVTLGAFNNAAPSQYAKVTMDDVRIYNRALSAAEVLAIYNATK